MATSNIIELKKQINYYFHNTYLSKYPLSVQDMLVHLFNDGKRIRPCLFIAFNHISHLTRIENSSEKELEKIDNEEEDNIWIEYAIDIELLHCLSLVIDDLPEMDNELERRGKTCFHIVYGLQKTNFFLYYMFSKLSNNLTNLLKFHNTNYSRISNKVSSEVSHKLFDDTNFIIHYLINNLIDGQYIDITSSKSMTSNLQSVIDSNINMVSQVILSIYTDGNNNECIEFIESDKLQTKNEKNKTNEDILSFKHHIMLNIKKTGTLFALPIITGFLFQLYKKNLTYTGKETIQDEFYIPRDNNIDNSNKLNLGDDNMINLIMTWALILGFLFQTSDDYLDRESDFINGKPNICNIIGVEASLKLLSKCTLFCRVMFEYIYKNTRLCWQNLVIDFNCINEIINLIQYRYQS